MKGISISVFFLLTILTGCSSLTLKPGDFSWPVESVLEVNKNGMIDDRQHYISLNVKNLIYEETRDSLQLSGITVRMIRDSEGYYFVTSSKFNSIYVMKQVEGGFQLKNKILISQGALKSPAFNQRPPYIQLLQESLPPVYLTKDGIVEGEKK